MKRPLKPLDILSDAVVREALSKSWNESNPGPTGGHEEGGFIVLELDDKLSVRRWPMGETSLIQVPAHSGCEVNGLPIVATFHTHPNTGPDYLQEPSETDKRGVKEDVNLKGSLYVGEFVITNGMIYLVTTNGAVREVDSRADLIG